MLSFLKNSATSSKVKKGSGSSMNVTKVLYTASIPLSCAEICLGNILPNLYYD